MKFNKISLMCAAAVGMATMTAPANAATFDFGFTSADGNFAIGTLDATGSGNTYTVTGISGVADFSVITGLSTYGGSDQLLFLSGSSNFDVAGVSFSDAAGESFNLTSYPGPTGNFLANSITNPGGDISFPTSPLTFFLLAPVSLTPPVPEPATWALMVTGFGMIGFAARRRQRVTVAYS